MPTRCDDRVSWLTEADHAVLALFVSEGQFLLDWLDLKWFIAEASFTLRNVLILLHDEHGVESICVFLSIQSSLRHYTFDFDGIDIISSHLLLLVLHGTNVVGIRHFHEVLLVLSHLRVQHNLLQFFDLFQHLLILAIVVLLLQGILLATSRQSSSFRLNCHPELSVLLLSQALEGLQDHLGRGILLVQLEETLEGLAILGIHEGLQPVPRVR